MASKFVYLLNAMEAAAQAEKPSLEGYAAKRRALLEYVEQVEEERATAVAFIAEMLEHIEQIMPMLKFVLRVSATDSATSVEKALEVDAANSNARGGTRTRKARRPGDFEATQRTDGTPSAHNELDDSESGSEDPDPSQVGPRSDRSGQDSATNPATSSSGTGWRR